MAVGARRLGPCLLLAGVAACATLGGGGQDPPEPSPRERLHQAAAALDRGDFRSAYPALAWVYTRCPTSRPGRDALLLMAAAELDPRNEARRPAVGASLSAEYLALPAAPVENRPLAETLYVLALELGAPRPTLLPPPVPDTLTRLSESCDPASTAGSVATAGVRALDADTAPAGAVPVWLPELPFASVPERLGRLEAQRDSASAQAAALLEQVKQLQTRVATQQQEIERIRKTLRP